MLQLLQEPVCSNLIGLKVIVPPRVVVRGRVVRVLGETVKVAGVGGRGNLEERRRLGPEGRRRPPGEGILNATYVRRDGRSQSSFPQTLPVKPFKPPEHGAKSI